MNPSTTPTPMTDSARLRRHESISSDWVHFTISEMLERELAEKTNEASNYHQHYRDEASKAQKFKKAFIEQEKEVERLRDLLKDHATFLRKNGFDRQADDLMRHAPTPEETQDGATMKEWYGGFSNVESTEPSNPTCATCRVFQSIEYSLHYLRDEVQQIYRALNVGAEDSGYNFGEIEKLKKEIQKLKEGK